MYIDPHDRSTQLRRIVIIILPIGPESGGSTNCTEFSMLQIIYKFFILFKSGAGHCKSSTLQHKLKVASVSHHNNFSLKCTNL